MSVLGLRLCKIHFPKIMQLKVQCDQYIYFFLLHGAFLTDATYTYSPKNTVLVSLTTVVLPESSQFKSKVAAHT